MEADGKNLNAWRQAIQALEQQVGSWWSRAGWRYERESYAKEPSVDVLTLSHNDDELHLEPTDWSLGEVPTAVDLYAWPTLIRVRLRGPYDGGWQVYSSDGIPMNVPWEEGAFKTLCEDILKAA